MIDIADEALLSLREAAKLLPSARQGRPVSFACVWRWVLHGCRAADGQLVRLEALRLGSRWVTSKEAIQRWAERLTPAVDDKPLSPPPTLKQRRKAAERAEKELERLGV
jgi:hypothetical protein